MAKRYFRKMAVLAKLETVYATDPTPTGSADAMQLTDVSFEPLAGEDVSRDLITPYFGHQGVILVGTHGRLEGSVEIAGAGAAGDAPAYGPLLRACGLAETIDAGVDVVYEPVSDAHESAAIYFNLDGVRHILLGARGTVSLSFVPRQIPRFRFTLTGLLGTISDTALPTVDLTAFVTPVPVNKANTAMSLHGWTSIAESLAVDLGNSVEPRFLIGEESVEVVNRQSTGTAVVEARSLATKNWFDIAQARTRAALSLTHGTAAGNIVEIAAPAVEIGRPTMGQTQGIANYSLPLMLCPDDGDDELSITVR